MLQLLKILSYVSFGSAVLLAVAFFGGDDAFSFSAVACASALSGVIAALYALMSGAKAGFMQRTSLVFAALFFVFEAVALANPETEFVRSSGVLQFTQNKCIGFLPSSVRDVEPWRSSLSALSVFAAAICMFFAASVLFASRAFFGFVSGALAVVSVLASAVFIAEKISHVDKFWFLLDAGTSKFSGAFWYHAQGDAMYMALMGFSAAVYAGAFAAGRVSVPKCALGLLGMVFPLAAVFCSDGSGGKIFASAEFAVLLVLPAARVVGGVAVLRIFSALFASFALSAAAFFAYVDFSEVPEAPFRGVGTVENGRIHLWKISTDMLDSGGDISRHVSGEPARLRHVLFGRGPASYSMLAKRYFHADAASVNEDYKDLKHGYKAPKYPHSYLLYILFEYGAITFAAGLLWLALWRREVGRAVARGSFAALAAFASASAILCYGVFDIVLENICVCVITAVLFAAAVSAKDGQ